jgi:hypothetical protein
VQGVRIHAIDVDRDGRTDVLVRGGGTRVEPLNTPPEARTLWLLRNLGDRFEDITADSFVLDWRQLFDVDLGRPMDVPAFGDVNADGWLDVYSGISTHVGAEPMGETSELLLGGPDGFRLVDEDHPIRRVGEPEQVAGAAWLDADLDGHLDLWTAHGAWLDGGRLVPTQDRLWRGDGTGALEDITLAAGLETVPWTTPGALNEARAHSRAWSAAACDLNNDGLPELLTGSYGRSPNHLWQARLEDGIVRYTNRSIDSGFAWDDDRTWQDNQFARCFCEANRAAEGCADVPAPQIGCTQPNWSHDSDREPWRLGGNTGAVVCADLDGDGFLDLIVTEIRHWWAGLGSDGTTILWNTGEPDVRFERRPREAIGLDVPIVTRGGWDEGHMTATVLDVDNDGLLDLYLGASDYAGNRGLLYRQVAPRRFQLLDADQSLLHHRSHGVAALDVDNDGAVDLLVGHSRSRCDATQPMDCYPTRQVRLFRNVVGQRGASVQLQLQGQGGMHPDAVGARIEIVTADRRQTRVVQAGYGHFGAQEDLVQHVGLGTSCEATVRVHWPDRARTVSEFTVGAGYRWVLSPAGMVAATPLQGP